MSYYGDYTHWAMLRDVDRQTVARPSPWQNGNPALEPSLGDILNTDNLIRVFWNLAKTNGQAPGADGVTYSDLGFREVASIMRWFAKFTLECNIYVPQPVRRRSIPKGNGKKRLLRIPTVVDRVAASALAEAMTPFWEARFLPGSYGFRPNRSTWQMLAHLDLLVNKEALPVLVVEDIEKAFDNVRLDQLNEDHERHIEQSELLWFIRAILVGSRTRGRRTVGIDQGNPYSPIGLNVRLHHAHDLRMAETDAEAAWLRFADNHLYICVNFREAQRVRDFAAERLSEAGLRFKEGGRCCVDLRKTMSTPVLGFKLSNADGRLLFSLNDNAPGGVFEDFADKLQKAHDAVDHWRQARAVVNGFINAYGPAWRNEVVCSRSRERILIELQLAGFSNVSCRAELHEWFHAAWRRWQRLRSSVWQRWETLRTGHSLDVAHSSA